MDKGLAGQVGHSRGHLSTVVQESWGINIHHSLLICPLVQEVVPKVTIFEHFNNQKDLLQQKNRQLMMAQYCNNALKLSSKKIIGVEYASNVGAPNTSTRAYRLYEKRACDFHSNCTVSKFKLLLNACAGGGGGGGGGGGQKETVWFTFHRAYWIESWVSVPSLVRDSLVL